MSYIGKKLFIKQQIEPLEILSGFETRNNYSVKDENQRDMFFASETSGNFFLKQFLSRNRKLKLNILDGEGNVILIIDRPFFWFRSDATVYLADGSVFGYIKQRSFFPRKGYDFYSPNGELVFSCVGKLFSNWWTFKILMQGQEVGIIKKKWSGFGREFLTDSDKFVIDFGNLQDDNLKYSILSIAFIIDLVVFERGG